jgi:23S rRNA (adenine2503-C2)-methyltransferase
MFIDEACITETLTLAKKIESNETTKFLFQTQSNHLIESVSMIENDRHTICLSSQVGCALDCDFCATGKMGFKKNLSSGEIIDQLLFIKHDIKKPITNIVFMGMGEPFLNYRNVIKAADLIHDSQALNFGSNRITISTAGVLPKIDQFIADKVPYNLAISLNGANNTIREKIMPINRKWPIEDLITSSKVYNKLNRKKITFEYVLIDKVNDSVSDAYELGSLLKNSSCKLNIIPFNEIGTEYKRPSNNRINDFVDTLKAVQKGFKVLVRWSNGVNIDAGCGQLAIKED